MFKYYFLILLFLCGVYVPGGAHAAMDYKQCLDAAIEHGNWILDHRRLHYSVRFCVRDSVAQARSLSQQYSQKIEPMMDAQNAKIKKCKKDENCKSVPDQEITYATSFDKNCNSFKIRYRYTCDMNRTLDGFVQKEPVSRLRFPQ